MSAVGLPIGYPHTKVTSIYDIDKGDHLCMDQKFYYHHFIIAANYVKQGGKQNGKELQIIEFDGAKTEAGGKIVMAERNLSELGRVYKIKYSSGEAFNSDEVVRRARKHVGEAGYNLIWNNCEHFASYCKTGKGESRQVQNAAIQLMTGSPLSATSAISLATNMLNQ